MKTRPPTHFPADTSNKSASMTPKAYSKHRQQGLNLLEILVCIAILEIFATMVMPTYQNLMEQRQIIAVAEAIAGDLRWVRSEAVKQNVDLMVVFEPGSAGTWRYTVSTPAAITLKTVESASNPEFVSVGLAENLRNDRTIFNASRGTTEAQNGTISLSSSRNNFNMNVILSNLGRAQICGLNESFGGYRKC